MGTSKTNANSVCMKIEFYSQGPVFKLINSNVKGELSDE